MSSTIATLVEGFDAMCAGEPAAFLIFAVAALVLVIVFNKFILNGSKTDGPITAAVAIVVVLFICLILYGVLANQEHTVSIWLAYYLVSSPILFVISALVTWAIASVFDSDKPKDPLKIRDKL